MIIAFPDFFCIIPKRKLAHMTKWPNISNKEPSLLNLYIGENAINELPVLHLDIEPLIQDEFHLPFKSDQFTIVRLVNIVENVSVEVLLGVLSEIRRILHRYGELYLCLGRTEKPPKPNLTLEDLDNMLTRVGFSQISKKSFREDITHQVSVSTNTEEYELIIAGNKKTPHTRDALLGEKEFRERCISFRRRFPNNPAATYIIAVFNEEKNLPHFLAFLESAKNETNTKREFIFVINGCTDNSENIIKKFADSTYLKVKVISSPIGIVAAYIAGIQARTLNGFIGKIDADVFLHPHILDLMQMHLVEEEHIQVSYAEPIPSDSKCDFNESDHVPEIMSKRLYYTSKTSLNRIDPFGIDEVKSILQGFRAEDMFLSFYFVYFFGLNSISRTPHGCVYAKTVRNYEDLVKQISRMNSEMEREFQAYPPFKILLRVLEQRIYPSKYQAIFNRAKAESAYVEEWTRIESTK